MRIKDDVNICLNCKNSRIYGKDKREDENEYRTFCVCICPNLTGGKKGYRRKCKHFIKRS